MKKVLFAVVLCLAAGMSYAQTDPKELKSLGDAQKKIYDEENMKLYLPGGNADKAKMYSAMEKMFEYYKKCYEAEEEQVKSGVLKKAKFTKKNADILMKVRPNLGNAGGDAFNEQDYAGAQKFFGLYVDSANDPMFEDKQAVMQADTIYTLYGAYAALAASMTQDKAAVVKYGEVGKNHKEEGYRALMCLAEVYGDPQEGDSVKWLNVIKEGVEKFPTQEFFVGNIMDYYIHHGQIDQAIAEINSAIETSGNAYFYYVKAVLLYEKKDYAATEAVCNEIIAKGDKFVAEANAKIGDCYFFQAQAIEEQNANLSLDDANYATNDAKMKELFRQAAPYYEKAKELKSDDTALWGQYLLRIYYKLNDPKYSSLEKELGY